jgi:hypothetical protein
MIQRLLILLPQQIGLLSLMIAIAGAALGGILWLGGSRFSRTLMTLIAVSTGALIGLQIPKWFSIGLQGWATAVLGALILGISGYLLHKFWVGLGLGVVLAVWAALGTFVVCADPKGWSWPISPAGASLHRQIIDFWNSLTPEARNLLPFTISAALLSGICASVLWPRVGSVLLYSAAGVSLMTGLGVTVLNSTKREWLRIVPGQTSSQVIVLICLVAFGAILQWRSISARAAVAQTPKDDEH